MNKNDIIELEITDLTNEGSGVGRYDGMAVFVPKTAAGDIISCRIVKVLKNYCFGKIEEIIKPSADRIENDCPAFGRCGGCVFRHINYSAELRAKEKFVRDAFERIGGLSPEFLPICGSENVSGYRNKLQMPLAKIDGEIVSGFFSERTHKVIPVEKCELQPEVFSKIIGFIKLKLKEFGISIYNEEKHTGAVRHIFLRKGHYSGEICVTLVARKNVPEFKKLAREISDKFPEVTGVVLNINPDKTNVILGEREVTLFGRAEIHDKMCGVDVEISPRSFYQVNTKAAENLYAHAAVFAEPDGKILLDLYCGAGTIGLSMADKAKRVFGAEIVPEAVENAKRIAVNYPNAEFICADAGEAAKEFKNRGIKPDVILLDPPRKGCDENTLRECAGMRPERIVMISCNPATAARDCKLLSELGYETEKVRAFDLFPRTKHVECIMWIQRKE